MSKIESLIEKCSMLDPLDGRVIILPGKVRTHKQKQMAARPKDPEVKEEDVDSETEMIMEEVMVDVNYRYQKATVLQKPVDETRFNVGDTIIYQVGTTFDFDLVKGASLIRKFDVVAVVKV